MNNTIEVVGSVKIERKISKYRVKISIVVDQNPYGDEKGSDLAEIKNQYYLALVENGIDVSKFVEDAFEYRANSNQMEGTLLKYECTSQKEMSKLLDIRVSGIYVNLIECKYIIEKDTYTKLIDEALADAKKRAEIIASKINKKVGEIVSVSDNRILNNYWSNYNVYDEFFDLKVVYKTE
ncbi:SIMPL domain-containing protein [Aureibaculum marinum]|uniref:SIMPL domain-containing protein n=1 Tax=Aureibaculum marinum TaxID=2487930 RepID=A0A3N4N3M3_9FLAO|nr:SIMPL domain-containing protein [Aureibaculum marinum]RPD90711.1 SIMPL domain-containing protein [Aureibaculum marinum]